MIRLVYSNQTEALLDALVESLQDHRRSPLEMLDVVVPNRHLEAYSRTGIAERLGIATGLRFGRLEGVIADSLVSPDGSEAAVLDHWELFGAVLGVLMGPPSHADPTLAPVRSYLDSVDDTDGRDLRSVQLARRVTHLYEEYILHRPEMLVRWRRGPGGVDQGGAAGDEIDETYRWQASLFHHAMQALRRDDASLRLSLDELVQEPHRRRLVRHAPLFVFGLSYVAPLYQRLFAILAENCALHLFTLNPCCEFWEDIETDREIRKRLARSHREVRVGTEALAQTEDPFGLLEDDDNVALRRWGIPGRESMRLLNEVSDCDFEPRFEVPEGTGVLSSLQRDILFRQPRSINAVGAGENSEREIATDESLRFVAVSDPRREAEVVVDEIWRSLRYEDSQITGSQGEPPLRFHQIAIIINRSSIANYLPHLEAAALDTGLPLAISDRPVRAVDHAVEGALLLLDLPFGDLARPEMLRFMTHPSVLGAEENVDPEEWADLAEDLGIVLGADHRAFEATYVDLDLLSWDQGIRRLVLGATLGNESPDDPTSIHFARRGEEYLPASGSAHADPTRLRFGLLARSLLRDVAAVRRGRHDLSRWSQLFQRLVRGYLRDDEGALDPVFRALEPLESMEPTGIEVSARVATELARGALAGLNSQRGNPLTDGVVTGSFLPMRAIPFRRIYVLGMGEGLFPAARRRDTLDLRSRNRRSGDVSPEDRDRYAFLETLLCTRDHLSLSWTARDPLTGESLRPSSAVRELMEIVDDRWGEGASQRLLRRPPANRDSAYPALLLPEASLSEADGPLSSPAQGEGQARRYGEELRSAWGPGAPAAYVEALEGGHPLDYGPVVARLLDLTVLTPGIPPALPTQIKDRHLREFLRCPLQAWGQVVAELRRDDDNDADLRGEEYFDTPALEIVVARRQAFLDSLLASSQPMDELSRALHLAELAGRSTVGTLLDLELEANQGFFDDWSQAAGALLTPVPTPIRRVVYGPRRRDDGCATGYPALSLEIEIPSTPSASNEELPTASVEFTGRTQPLFGPHGTILVFHHRKLNRGQALDMLLSAWIDHLALALLEGTATQPRLVVVCGTEKSRFDFQLAPITESSAREILSDLAADLMTGDHDDLLPSIAVFEASSSESGLDGLTPASLQRALRRTIDRPGDACRYGAVPNPMAYPLAEVDSALVRVRRRFGPLFDSLSETAP